MQVGETVVLVEDVDGMPAGKEGPVMRVRGDMLLIGCRSAHEKRDPSPPVMLIS